MGVVNDIEYEQMFLVNGKEVSVKTKQKNEISANIELVKALTIIENERNAQKHFCEFKKQYHVEYKGVVSIIKTSKKY